MAPALSSFGRWVLRSCRSCSGLSFSRNATAATFPCSTSSIATLSRAISRSLDEHDPIEGHYTLEVGTPGLERPLRTATHFAHAVGSTVKVKTKPGTEGDRRLEGTITSADDDTVTVTSDDGTARRLAYADIERARTTFEWGGAAKHKQVLDQNTEAALTKLAEAGVLNAGDAEILVPAARLYHTLTQVLRLCLDKPFVADEAPRALKDLLARAADMPDFSTLEAALKDTLEAVHGAFGHIVQ